jgi:hypothetical protein
MRFILAVSFVSLTACSLAAPVTTPQHGDITRVNGAELDTHGIAPISHNLPSDNYPHKDDATKYSSKFNAGSQISTGKPVRANPPNMNKKNQQLGSIGSRELGGSKAKIGKSRFSPYNSSLTTDLFSR